MLTQRRIVILLVLLILAMFTVSVYAADVSITSTLNGRVSSINLVQAGQTVKEGQPLVMIESLTGTAPAARATADGTITQVLVQPGDMISSGQVVAIIRTAN